MDAPFSEFFPPPPAITFFLLLPSVIMLLPVDGKLQSHFSGFIVRISAQPLPPITLGEAVHLNF